MTENRETVTRDVSGFLLVKDGDTWRIAAQAWDLVADFEAFGALLAGRNPAGGQIGLEKPNGAD